MGEKTLTVTVPAYNAEKFLNRGIPSMLDDRILNEIEILIINDGSNDRTAEIANTYQEKYRETVKAIHKKNGGHGSAVNAGIENATAKYFCVIDADDWVDKNSFVELVLYLKHANVDLVLSDAQKVDEEDRKIADMKISNMPVRKETDLDKYIEKMQNIEMHNIVFKTKLLQENNIKIDEHCYYVDQEYVLFTLLHVKTVTYSNLLVYHYYVGRNGQSVSIESRRKNIKMYEKVCDVLVNFYHDNKKSMSQQREKFYQKKIAIHIGGLYSTYLSYNTTDAKEKMIQYDNKLKHLDQEIYIANEYLSIDMLRKSKFCLYSIESFIYRKINHIKN